MDFLSCHVVLWHSWSANIWNSRSCFLIFIRSVQCVSTVLFTHHVKPTLVICHQYNCMYENPAVYDTVLNNLTEKRIHKQSIALSALSADFLPPPPQPRFDLSTISTTSLFSLSPPSLRFHVLVSTTVSLLLFFKSQLHYPESKSTTAHFGHRHWCSVWRGER